MRLKKLSLRDFLNHRDTTIEFGDLTVIAGPNNAGKSAIKDAIEMTLTGTARTTDRAGREAANVIRAGAGHFDLRAEVAAAGHDAAGDGGESRLNLVISRSKSHAGDHVFEVTEGGERTWEGSIPQKQKVLYQALGADAGVIRACLHAGSLPRMKSDEQEALIFGTLGLHFTDQRICELLQTCGCAEDDVQLLYAGRDKTFLAAPARETYGPEIFDEAYRYAYEKRRQTKRDLGKARDELDNAGERVAALERETPKLAQLDEGWLKRNEAKLAELTDERDRLLKEQGRSESLPKEIAAVEETIERLKAQVKSIRQWKKAAEKVAGTAGFDGVVKKQKGLLEDRRRSLQNLEIELATTESAIEAFSGGSPKCPLTDAECPMSEDDQKKLLKSLRSKRTKLRKSVKSVKEEVTESGETVAKLQSLADSRPESSEEEAEAELEGSRKCLKELKAQEKETDGGVIELLKGRIEKGRMLFRTVEAYDRAKSSVAEKKKAYKELEQRVESWERLVKALGPGEAKLKAVEKPLEDLEFRINERLSKYAPGYAIRMETEGGFELKVSTPETLGEWIPMNGLSTSERLRVGIVLEDAVSRLSGLRFLLIDELDTLLPTNRNMLGAAIAAWREEYDSVVLIVSTEDRPKAVEGRTTYWIEHGTAEVVTA